MKVTVEKYHGLGNDYLIYNPEQNPFPLTAKRVRLICNRNIGVGADGILEGPLFGEDGLDVRIWNPDGSLAEKSGNGIRIYAKYLKDAGYVEKKHVTIQTAGGPVRVEFLTETGGKLTVSMGKLSFWSNEIPVTGKRREVIDETMTFNEIPYKTTCVSIGNPHCVIFLKEISKKIVCRIGRYSETAEYFPDRINTTIMNVIDRTHIEIETYERGAGYTLASGTSCCAAAGVAHRLGLVDPKTYVKMPGGVMEIEIEEDGEVHMTGEVRYVAKMKLGEELSQQLRAL
ncbi:MAG: diaminopimelate epimerase [Lachnospiraceae bacterium]|nr:diaminopimelate epimerase [Lachnospiraceae bacterium]